MSTMRVFFGMLIFCAGSHIASAHENGFAQMKAFNIEEKASGLGELQFIIARNESYPLETNVEVVASCSDGNRRMLMGSPSNHFELITEYFSDAQVRQYVVKLFGREIGFIKVERPNLRKETEYKQARLEITDPSDRIIGEVANAENGEKELIVRDVVTRQIIARAHSRGQSWEVESNALHPLLSAVLLCASRVERVPCLPEKNIVSYIAKPALATAIVLGGLGAAYAVFRKGR